MLSCNVLEIRNQHPAFSPRRCIKELVSVPVAIGSIEGGGSTPLSVEQERGPRSLSLYENANDVSPAGGPGSVRYLLTNPR